MLTPLRGESMAPVATNFRPILCVDSCGRPAFGQARRPTQFVVPADFFVVDNTPHGTVLVRDRRQALVAERLVRGRQRDAVCENGGDLHGRRQETPTEHQGRQRRGEQICMKAFDRFIPQVSGVTTTPVV